MKKALPIFTIVALSIQLMYCQDAPPSEPTVLYHINDNVKNSAEDYFVQISDTWRTYLNSNYFFRRDNEHWNYDEYAIPEIGYQPLLMDLRRKFHYGGKIQCSVAGIVPVENNYYLLKSIFTERVDSTDMVNINFIISVYAKIDNEKVQFYNGIQYFKEIYENRKVGGINYIIHPDHEFDVSAASRMGSANTEIAKQFEMSPIEFDYVIANDTRDLSEMTGVHLFEYSYQPVASGGFADTYNNIIYAGNNSAYYPHEAVHLYTNSKFRMQGHPWVDEGIAALIGGSTGYDIEWHWEKLRRFLIKSPDYKMDNLTDLQTYIPNGEFMTDFRYAIGAIICQKIIEKEGMQGIFEALQAGRSEDNYFEMLKQKLNVEREDFGKYVKTEILKLQPISDEVIEAFEY